jgi:hypothetical protein
LSECIYVMKKPSWVAIVKKIWLWSSSVIKIVQMKYNRINIKWRHVSTSFKIYLEMISYLYITFTIFYYNSISLKGTFVSVLVKGHLKKYISYRLILNSSSAMALIMYILRSYQFRNLLTLIVENWSKFWY